MRQDKALASSWFYAKIKKDTVGKIISVLRLSEKINQSTIHYKVCEKGFEKTQVACILAISFFQDVRDRLCDTYPMRIATTTGS